jgi:hypothetical protein
LLNATLDDLTIVADSHISAAGSNSGVIALTLDPVSPQAVGTLLIQGVLRDTLDTLVPAITGAVLVKGSATVTLGGLGISATGAQGTLGAPTLGYPSPAATNPTTISIKLPGDWISGDILKLDRSASVTMSTPTTLTHTLTDTDAAAGSVSIGLSGVTLSGVTYFQAYGQRSGLDSVNRSNIVTWGDTTAPTITTSATQNNVETQPLAIALAGTDTGGIASWAITGGADQLQFEISGTLLRWIGNGVQSFAAPLDQGSDNVYNVTVTATDYGGNTASLNIAVTVSQADTTPDAFSWTNTTNAPANTLEQASNTWVVTGLGAGINAPLTVTGGEIRISHDQGTTWTAWGSASTTVANGDWIQARGTSSATGGATVNVAVKVGTFTATYQITTIGVSNQLDTTINSASSGGAYTYSNGNTTAKNTNGIGNKLVLSVASHSTGKFYFEATADSVNSGCGIGVGDASANVASFMGADAHSAGWLANSTVWYNNGIVTSYGTWTTGDRLAAALDADAKKLWLGKFVSGSVVWQSGNPSTGTGGLSLSNASTGTTFRALLQPGALNLQMTIYEDAATQIGALPTGFAAWAS